MVTALAVEEVEWNFTYVDPQDAEIFVELCLEAYEESFNYMDFPVFPDLLVVDGDINPDLFSLYVFLYEHIKQELFDGVDFDHLSDQAQSEATDSIHEDLWEDEGIFMDDVMHVFDRYQLFYIVDHDPNKYYEPLRKHHYTYHNSPLQEVW